jgi:nitroreductase
MSGRPPVTETILQRFSCRTYRPVPLAEADRALLSERARSLTEGPLGNRLRFRLAASTEESADALKGLGTYGFIRGASAFVVGAVSPGERHLEDYGYGLEQLVLFATSLGLGTCWLGGSFTRSSFSRAVEATWQERVPAVAAVGVIPDLEAARGGIIRRRVGADLRLPWERLFFDAAFGVPLSRADAGDFAEPLEMLRRGPSASNKQPWRVVRDGGHGTPRHSGGHGTPRHSGGAGAAWHFYLQRTPGYRGGLAGKLLRLEDIQRVDIGIAMCHFEIVLREAGGTGKWVLRPPVIETPRDVEYVVTWEG